MAQSLQELWQQAQNQQALGALDAAEKTHRQIVKVRPDVLQSWSFLSSRAAERGDLLGQAEAIRQYLKYDDLSAPAWQSLAFSLLAQGFAAEALMAFLQALGLQPDEPLILLSVSCAAEMLNDDALSLRCFSLAVHDLSDRKKAEMFERAHPMLAEFLGHAEEKLKEHQAGFTLETYQDWLSGRDENLVAGEVSLAKANQANDDFRTGHTHLKNNNQQAAIRSFKETLAENPTHKHALALMADISFSNKEVDKGLFYLRKLSDLSLTRGLLHHRLAVKEEAEGNIEEARQAHLRSLKADTNMMLPFLYAGYFFEVQGEADLAAQLYSLGDEGNSGLTNVHNKPETDPETKKRSATADALLKQHFAELHNHAIKARKGGRVRKAVWPQVNWNQVDYQNPAQQPDQFYIPNLKQITFADRSDMPWAAGLEAAFTDIRDELHALLPSAAGFGRPYLHGRLQLGEEFTPLKGTDNWTALDLFRDGKANDVLLSHFPKTLAALEGLPLAKFGEHPFEVFFSLLKPHQHIPPHFGPSNHGVTVHLPIIVPDACKIRVSDEWRTWQEGQILAFDDAFDHEARNDSDELRVVLIFEIWHPDLTVGEIEAVKATFNARDAWMNSRTIPEVS